MGTFEDLTPDNGAIKTLQELIPMTTFKDESLEALFTLMTSARNGKKLGFIGRHGRCRNETDEPM